MPHARASDASSHYPITLAQRAWIPFRCLEIIIRHTVRHLCSAKRSNELFTVRHTGKLSYARLELDVLADPSAADWKMGLDETTGLSVYR
jgi:hypothetical protein